MYRRPRLLTIIFICLLSIGFPSCGSDYVAYRDINDVIIYDLETHTSWYTPVTTSSDSIALRVSMKLTYFTDHYILPALMNEAWATSPREPILANEIVDIRLYCNKPMYGLPAQTNLIDELLIGYHPLEKFEPADFLTYLPAKGDYLAIDEIYIFFPAKPAPDVYNFTVEIEDNNGHIFTAPAPAVAWE